MITIAIELNNVIRNFNKQLLKYYQRDYQNDLDIDKIDDIQENVIDKYIKFDSKKELKEFIYIDYPYELFGCAKPMSKNLATNINMWMENIGNIENEDIRVIYFSLNEDALTIQSSYFFLSKIGTRVRETIFPIDIDELKDKCDVVISSEHSTLKWAKDNEKLPVEIRTNWKMTDDDIHTKDFDLSYESMEDIIEDDKFFTKVIEYKHNS